MMSGAFGGVLGSLVVVGALACEARAIEPTWDDAVLTVDGRELRPVEVVDPAAAAAAAPRAVAGAGGPGVAIEAGAVRYSLRVIEKRDAPDLHERQIFGYRVAATGPDGESLWWCDFLSAGDVGSPGFGLLSGGGPRYATSAIEPLSVVGGRLIVCAGPSQDIIALDLKTGKTVWQIEAIWEFERGFIGPSVWQHFIGRFGDHRFESAADAVPEKHAEMRKRLRETCKIVAGPFAVPHEGSHRLFVAVARSHGPFGGYLADCFVYEVGAERGSVEAVIPMPRMVLGHTRRVVADGVVLACENGAVAKVAPSSQSAGLGMGPGGSDRLGRLAWYVAPLAPGGGRSGGGGPRPGAWLTTGALRDVVALGERDAYVAGGAFVERPGAKVFHLPIARTRLPGGDATEILLRVPFRGDVERPETNYGQEGDALYTFGPYLLGITGLEVRPDGRLAVTVGTESGARTLIFALP